MTPLPFLGLGTAVPPFSIQQPAAAELASRLKVARGEERLVSIAYRRSGVSSRHSVVLEGPVTDEVPQSFYPAALDDLDLGPTTGERIRRYEQEAAKLAGAAVTNALRDSGVAAAEITHLITVSCTGFSAPGFDLELMRDFKLRPGVSRTHLGFMGCHGLLNGLRVASAYHAADPSAKVLVVALEVCTVHQQYTSDPGQIIANALFADGAAAIVCGTPASGSPAGWQLLRNGSHVVADSEDAMSWRIGDHGFAMTLAPSVPKLIGELLRPWLTDWLRKSGLQLGDIRHWAVHPGGPKILQAVQDCLNLPANALATSHRVLSEFGNMSSPTLAFILQRLQRTPTAGPCVMLGFGPGLTIEAALLEG